MNGLGDPKTPHYPDALSTVRMSSSEDFTHVVHNASTPEKRSDYRLVSERIEVLECEIWNGVGSSANGLEVSDHAPVVATVTLE